MYNTKKKFDRQINCRIVVSYTLPCRCSFDLSISLFLFQFYIFFIIIIFFFFVCVCVSHFLLLEKRVTRQLIVVVRFLMKHERLPKHRRLAFFQFLPFYFVELI
jgi:hypothetical protein